MKVFISGAGGFVGSHVAEAMRDAGYEVTAAASFRSQDTYGWLDEVEGVNKIRCDIRDGEHLREIIKGHQVVCNLAALISVADSYARPRSYVETNVIGTMNVLLAAREIGAKVIHASSSEVYGTAQYVPMDERHPIVPQSPYAASKVAADALVESFRRSYDMSIVTLRPFNTFGPRQSQRAVIPKIITAFLRGERNLKMGAINTVRDFTYVKCVAKAYVAALSLVNGIYNIASEEAESISVLIKTIATLMKIENYSVDSEHLRPEESEVLELVGDAGKFKKLSGWRAPFDLTNGLNDTIDWFRQYPNRKGDFV